MSNKGIISVPMILTEEQERDIQRFYDTCEDGQGYDVPKDRMKSLARIGLVRTTGFSRYEITDAGDAVIEGLRVEPALESRNKCGVQMVDCPECSHQWDHFFECTKRTALLQGEPVALSAVGVLRADGDGGLAPEWILEGGTAELWEGAVLLITDTAPDLCGEDGHCELYRHPPEQPAPADVLALASQLSISQRSLATTVARNTALNTQIMSLHEMIKVSAQKNNSLRKKIANDPTLKEVSNIKDDNNRYKERIRLLSRMARAERNKYKMVLSENGKLMELLNHWLQSANVSDDVQASLCLNTSSVLTKSSFDKKKAVSGGAE